MNKYYFAAILAVVLTGVAQVLLKKGAILAMKEKSMLKSYLNSYSVVAYGLFFIVTLLSLLSMKKILVKEMVIFLPLTYLIVPLLSRIFLKESVSKSQLIGILLVAAGIAVFSFDVLFK